MTKAKQKDCEKIFGWKGQEGINLCATLEKKEQEQVKTLQSRAAQEDYFMNALVTKALYELPVGWRRTSDHGWRKQFSGRTAIVHGTAYGNAFTLELLDGMGRIWGALDRSLNRLPMEFAIHLGEMFLGGEDDGGFAPEQEIPRLQQSSSKQGETVMETKRIKELVDQSMNPQYTDEQEYADARARAKPRAFTAKDVHDVVKTVLEPLRLDIQAIQAKSVSPAQREIGAQGKLQMINRSIQVNGGIQPDGKIKPGAAVRASMGLTYRGEGVPSEGSGPERPQNYRDVVRRSVEPRPQMAPRWSQESVSMALRSAPVPTAIRYRSELMPELIFNSAAERDRYDGQMRKANTGEELASAVTTRSIARNIG